MNIEKVLFVIGILCIYELVATISRLITLTIGLENSSVKMVDRLAGFVFWVAIYLGVLAAKEFLK